MAKPIMRLPAVAVILLACSCDPAPDGPGEVETGVHVDLDTLESVIEPRPPGRMPSGGLGNGQRQAGRY